MVLYIKTIVSIYVKFIPRFIRRLDDIRLWMIQISNLAKGMNIALVLPGAKDVCFIWIFSVSEFGHFNSPALKYNVFSTITSPWLLPYTAFVAITITVAIISCFVLVTSLGTMKYRETHNIKDNSYSQRVLQSLSV